jgi:clan AA aspartic protease
MITGTVNADRQAVVGLLVRGPNGQEQEIEAVIDTGFDGFLALPPTLAASLGLVRLSRGRAILANGSEEIFDIYRASVVWDGLPWNVEADAVGATPLVGMSLLYGYDLLIEAVDGGSVVIRLHDTRL